MIQLLLGGLAIGSVYALIAIGIVLSFRATGIVNFAFGELMMISAYGFVLTQGMTSSAALQLLAALAVGAAGGLVCFVLTAWLLRGAAEMALVIGTLGLLILLQSGARALFTDTPMPVDPWLLGQRDFSLFGEYLPGNALLVLAATLVITAILLLWQSRTLFGRAVLAAAEDPWRAALSGIHVRFTLAMSWIISGAVAGLAGMLLGPVVGVFPAMGADIIFPAFISAIIGGFSSIGGALTGGLLLGLLQTFTIVYLGGAMKEPVMFGFLLLFLLWRPTGLVRAAASRRV